MKRIMREKSLNYISVKQGEFRISNASDDVLIGILGSCVAVCLHDPLTHIGGMNHFLLPGQDPKAGQHNKYGAHAMEQLVNGMLRAGAARANLEAQVFGGAKMMKGGGRIGPSNARFAQDFLTFEGYRVVRGDTGGLVARRVQFHPTSGRAELIHLGNQHQPPEQTTSDSSSQTGHVELF